MTSRVFKRSLYALKNKTVWSIILYSPFEESNSCGGRINKIEVDGEYLRYKDYYIKNEGSNNCKRVERTTKIHRKYIKYIDILD